MSVARMHARLGAGRGERVLGRADRFRGHLHIEFTVTQLKTLRGVRWARPRRIARA